MNNGLLDESFAYYLEKESEIRGLVDDLPGLDDRNRYEVTRFLNGFFEDIQNPKSVERKFINRCI